MSYAEAPTLNQERVRLELLSTGHQEDLAEAVLPGRLWEIWYVAVPSPEEMGVAIAQHLHEHQAGTRAPWAIIDRFSGRAVGVTTYLNLDEQNRRLEIGSTWLGLGAQRTGINSAAKLLLLTRAFEDLGCHAVEFRTHWHNHQSRAAIASLGAKQDGVLRNHKILPNATVRDTVVYSILDTEWPSVKLGLQARLTRSER